VEIGEDHGGMCFGDGVLYATGSTLGKGNLEKIPFGKLAVTLIERDWLPEVMGFVPCGACGELTAKAYLRVVGDKHLCIPCSGYER
jgi:formylmethanofuran dehydrogenase subunit E